MDVNSNEHVGGDHNRTCHEWDLNMDAYLFADDNGFDEVRDVHREIIDVQDEIRDVHEEEEGDGEGDGEGEGCILSAPAVGDVFGSVEEAFEYFGIYGKQSGFGVCKRSNHKKGDDIYHYTFACNKYKKRGDKIVDGEPALERRRPFVGTNCKACLSITRSIEDTGKWEVCTVNLEHNHELTPETAFLITSYRHIPTRHKKMLEYNEDQGMAPGFNIDIVTKSAGGYLNCTFTRRDARNHVDKYRTAKLRALGGDDAVLLADFFEKKHLSDPNFFYSYKFTNEGRLWNIFWADGRGRAAYKYFHDVVVLDATYLTNR